LFGLNVLRIGRVQAFKGSINYLLSARVRQEVSSAFRRWIAVAAGKPHEGLIVTQSRTFFFASKNTNDRRHALCVLWVARQMLSEFACCGRQEVHGVDLLDEFFLLRCREFAKALTWQPEYRCGNNSGGYPSRNDLVDASPPLCAQMFPTHTTFSCGATMHFGGQIPRAQCEKKWHS
jgi:hypothetical protein